MAEKMEEVALAGTTGKEQKEKKDTSKGKGGKGKQKQKSDKPPKNPPSPKKDSKKKEKKEARPTTESQTHKDSPNPNASEEGKVFQTATQTDIITTYCTNRMEVDEASMEVHSPVGFVHRMIREIFNHVVKLHYTNVFDSARYVLITLRHHLEAALFAYLRAASFTTFMAPIQQEFNSHRMQNILVEPYLAHVFNAFMPIRGAVQITWEDVFIKMVRGITVLDKFIQDNLPAQITLAQQARVNEIMASQMHDPLILEIMDVLSNVNIYFLNPENQVFRYLFPAKQVVQIEHWPTLRFSSSIFNTYQSTHNLHYVHYDIRFRNHQFSSMVLPSGVHYLMTPPPEVSALLTDTCSCLWYKLVAEHVDIAPQWATRITAALLPAQLNPQVEAPREAVSRVASPRMDLDNVPSVHVMTQQERRHTFRVTNATPANGYPQQVSLTTAQIRQLAPHAFVFNPVNGSVEFPVPVPNPAAFLLQQFAQQI